jgi:hypothetical protein
MLKGGAILATDHPHRISCPSSLVAVFGPERMQSIAGPKKDVTISCDETLCYEVACCLSWADRLKAGMEREVEVSSARK